MTSSRTNKSLATRMRLAAPACAVLLAIVTGCTNARIEVRPPVEAQQALDRINANLQKIDGALYCKPALVSFRFRDSEGGDRRFVGHPATVIFEAPSCLYFDIKSPLAGSVARIGCDDERYWLWIDVSDTRKLWYGTWEALRAGGARRIAVPPDRLLDAMMMRPLPLEMSQAGRPLLLASKKESRLVFLADDSQNWPFAEREFVLDDKAPYMPLEIIDRLADGEVVMHAYLSGYKPVSGTGANGPYTPRKYVVYWPADGAEMRLDLSNVRYREKDTPFCDFPDGWQGEVEILDEWELSLDYQEKQEGSE